MNSEDKPISRDRSSMSLGVIVVMHFALGDPLPPGTAAPTQTTPQAPEEH